jgi:hypothetical protein
VRPLIRWTGAVTVIAALAIQLLPQSSVIPDALVAPALPEQRQAIALLPQALESYSLADVLADPFELPSQPAAPPLPPVPAAPTPAPAKPTAPAFSYRYFGQMTNPEGKTLYYIARADKEFVVQERQVLDDGYMVEAITTRVIRFTHPNAELPVELALPTSLELEKK